MSAQQDTIRTDSIQYVIIDAERSVFITEGDSLTQLLYGDVKAFHDGTFMYSDSARYSGDVFTAMSNVVMLQGDTIRLFADSLRYESDTSMAYLYDEVVLRYQDQELYTDRLVYNADMQIAYYYDTAVLVQQTSTVKSLKGVFDIDNEISYYYHYVTVQDGDFRLRSDSLVYYNSIQKAVFNSPTRITTSEAEIYCEDGYYDINDSLGMFRIEAQYIGGSTTALADSIYYDGKEGMIELMGNARYYHEGDTATADFIQYDERSGDVLLRGAADYQGVDRHAKGDVIRYNEITEAFSTEGRSDLQDQEKRILADRLTYDKEKGAGQALGTVDFRDTINKSRILADSLDFRDTDEYVLATAKEGKPVYSQLMDGDSIYISADTLRSLQVIDTIYSYLPIDTIVWTDTVVVDDTVRVDSISFVERDSIVYSESSTIDTTNYIIADNDVEIYKLDLQAVADSMAYDRQDSTISLLGNPLLWSDTTQFDADTFLIHMANDQIDHIEMIGNAMIISSTDLVYFSQIAGRRIDAFFVDGALDSMVVTGNAQSIYYMEDEEDGYIGVNSTVCARIVFLFEEEDLSDIKFYNDNESQILPIEGTDHEAIKLDGFIWRIEIRPNDPTDLRT